MKRLLSIALLITLLVTLLPTNTYAAANLEADTSIIYLDDGSYITVELTWTDARATGTRTGSKTYVYKGSNGDEQWRAVLRGTFTYTGSTVACTAASCDVTITNTNWYIVSKSATKSGNAAVGELTMGRKFLGITVDKESISMRITCDANGNLS